LNKGFTINDIIKNKVNTKIPNLKKLPNSYNIELSIGVIIIKKAIAPKVIAISDIKTSNTLFTGSLNLLVNWSYSIKIDS